MVIIVSSMLGQMITIVIRVLHILLIFVLRHLILFMVVMYEIFQLRSWAALMHLHTGFRVTAFLMLANIRDLKTKSTGSCIGMALKYYDIIVLSGL